MWVLLCFLVPAYKIFTWTCGCRRKDDAVEGSKAFCEQKTSEQYHEEGIDYTAKEMIRLRQTRAYAKWFHSRTGPPKHSNELPFAARALGWCFVACSAAIMTLLWPLSVSTAPAPQTGQLNPFAVEWLSHLIASWFILTAIYTFVFAMLEWAKDYNASAAGESWWCDPYYYRMPSKWTLLVMGIAVAMSLRTQIDAASTPNPYATSTMQVLSIADLHPSKGATLMWDQLGGVVGTLLAPGLRGVVGIIVACTGVLLLVPVRAVVCFVLVTAAFISFFAQLWSFLPLAKYVDAERGTEIAWVLSCYQGMALATRGARALKHTFMVELICAGIGWVMRMETTRFNVLLQQVGMMLQPPFMWMMGILGASNIATRVILLTQFLNTKRMCGDTYLHSIYPNDVTCEYVSQALIAMACGLVLFVLVRFFTVTKGFGRWLEVGASVLMGLALFCSDPSHPAWVTVVDEGGLPVIAWFAILLNLQYLFVCLFV